MYENEISLPINFQKGKRNVFIDWWFVEAGYGMPFWKSYQLKYGTDPWFSPYGVELVVNKPEIERTPFLSDDPSGGLRAYSTLLYEEGVYRFWYETDGSFNMGDRGAIILYMESKDLINWKRPVLNVIEHKASIENNIVYGTGPEAKGGLTGAHGATVFSDPKAPDSERYKLVYLGQATEGELPYNWVYGAISPDGINWTKVKEPLIKHTSDTQTVALYDEETAQYVMYLRGWSPANRYGSGGRRVIKRSESPQFGAFSLPQTVLAPDVQWQPSTDIYTNAYHKWPNADMAHIMLPSLYDRNTDTLDIHLFLSRDAVHWYTPQAKPIISNTNKIETSAFYVGKGLVPYEKTKWAFPVYYSPRGHNEYTSIPQGMHIATIRQDGFIGLEAKIRGEFYTYPCKFDGSRLLLNSYSHSGGKIKVELIEVKPELETVVVEGFALDECDGVSGDAFFKPVTWKGIDDISHLKDKVLRVRFYLIRSKLFSFMFE
ncbi:MAG: hypothetical protein L3V56_00670 [Candidatus Magnetoovum sp. WYHC-5]|nr:hypothetical protein [Candidatus Magnetoovum sp. WYHC-5]